MVVPLTSRVGQISWQEDGNADGGSLVRFRDVVREDVRPCDTGSGPGDTNQRGFWFLGLCKARHGYLMKLQGCLIQV
jgi:hypothetical protein